MKIGIVTDAAADLTEEEVKRLQIEEIELPVIFEGETVPCRDKDEFWNKLISGKLARTSQPNPEVLKNLFQQAEKEGNALICIFMSSRLSGTFACAEAVRRQVGYEHIYLVDSLNVTAGEKLLVTKACQLRDQGSAPGEIVEQLENIKPRIRLYACIDTLKFLARGGRITKTTANIGSILNIKPLCSITDGMVQIYGKTIGVKIAMKKLIDHFKSQKTDEAFPPVPLYAYNDKNCTEFVRRANESGLKINGNLRTPIGATIGTHIGPGGFGIVYVVKAES
ncbi:MAG: DegV family protein [Candidatus Scatosoma sp.]